MKIKRLTITAVVIATFTLAGCGSSTDSGLVKQAGVHGNALEEIYKLYGSDVLDNVSNRDLKDVNAALEAEDLNKATAGDLRRAQAEIADRIDELEKFRKRLVAADRKLRRTPEPDFKASFDKSFATDKFAEDYSEVTQLTEKAGRDGILVVRYAVSSFEKYLDFLEAWEGYLGDNDTSRLSATAEASDKSLARLQRQIRIAERGGDLGKRLDPLIEDMADAASDEAQIQDLITDLKADYPESFLPVHIVEK